MSFEKTDLRQLEMAMTTIIKTVATLMLLLLVLPLNIALTAIALLRSAVVQPPKTIASDPKTILISGGKMTKALQLARSFDRAGHRVILIESHKYWLTGHRFSWTVDRFYTVPKPQAKGYLDALLEIVQQERVDIYVPVCSPVASYYDAEAKQVLSKYCEVMHFDPELVQKLDDKAEFSAIAASFGLSVPNSYRITNPQQILDFDFSQQAQTYILKSIPYDSVRRLNLSQLPCDTPLATAAFVEELPISESNPWIMQAFIPGQEYCTHSTVRNGELQLHCCCESSAFQINYEMVDKPEIEAWVRKFVKGLNLTGQVSFDFIQADNGSLYAIECNPRTHSAITMFYDRPDVASAYLESDFPFIQPLKSSRPTYWIYHEIWRLATQPIQIGQRLKIIASGKDAIFDWADPLPFLMVHHAQIPWLLLENLLQLKGWIRIDFNIGKLVELAGD
jgi:hypothetical protein